MPMPGITKSDQVLEAIFSMLRWLFLLASAWIYLAYYYTPESSLFFWCLFGFGATYMGVTQYILFQAKVDSKPYYVITRLGVLFDYIAVVALMAITGWSGSPMFPIGYLIILHASVYWGLKGGLVTSAALAIGYLLVQWIGDHRLPDRAVPYHAMNYVYLVFVGALGGLIVARERKHLSEKDLFESMAKTDSLTGLYNHRTFQEQIRETAGKSRPFAVAMADIDYFKTVNDRYGHQTGDVVLQGIATTLSDAVPREVGTVFRYGGEEFALIVRMSDPRDVDSLLAAVRASIAKQSFEGEGGSFQVTMSFGYAMVRGGTAGEAVKQADDALYRAKREGRNRVVRYDGEAADAAKPRLEA